MHGFSDWNRFTAGVAALSRFATHGLMAWVVGVAVACSAPPPHWVESQGPAREGSDAATKPDLRGAYRSGIWLPLPEVGGAVEVDRDPVGNALLLVHGVRLQDAPDGALTRAEAELPIRQTRATPLPDRLGGGYLFYADERGATSIWRSATFAGKLEPFGRLTPEISRIVPGFDRLYVTQGDAARLRGLDAKSGEDIGLGPLPAASAFGALVFWDSWMGLVQADVRGLLGSFDAGLTWHPLGLPYPGAARTWTTEQGIDVDTSIGRYTLTPDGRVQRTLGDHGDQLFARASEVQSSAPDESEDAPTLAPLGRRPLRTALLHGFRDGADTALVAYGGYVGRVRLTDGKLVESRPAHFVGSTTCHTVPLGDALGFVCGEGDEATTLYAREGRLGIRPLIQFPGPRTILLSGNGGLVIEGPCPGATPSEATPPGAMNDFHCVRSPAGKLFQVRVQGDVGVERVSVLADGRAVVLIPPRLGVPGSLSVVDDDGPHSQPLDLGAVDADTGRLLRNGLWLNGLEASAAGEFATWVVGADTFVGVRVALSGKVRASAVRRELGHTHFSGGIALTLGVEGGAWESTNHGFDSRVVSVPNSLDTDAINDAPAWSSVRGCSALGCVWPTWLRVGYSKSEEVPPPAREVPPFIIGKAPPYQRFAFDCVPTGAKTLPTRVSFPSQPPSGSARWNLRRMSPLLTLDTLHSTPWEPFLGRPPPAKPAAFLGFATGERAAPTSYWAYAWGPRALSWGREANWQVVAEDPFALDATWASERARSPWSDGVVAAQMFGSDPSFTATWSVASEVSGTALALAIRHPSGSELYLVERGRSPLAIPWAYDGGLAAAKVGGKWFLATPNGSGVKVFRVDGSEVVPLGEYPVFVHDGTTLPGLVRTRTGDALGLWLRSSRSGWYVYPIDTESGTVAEPEQVSLEELSQVPATCEPDADGWLVESGFPLPSTTPSQSNVFVDLGQENESQQVSRLSARLVLDHGKACVRELSGDIDGPPLVSLAAPSEPLVRRRLPLVLRDRAVESRYGFVCR